MPQISVIIPVYNCAETLIRAVESVLQQTLRDIEVVIVDDCSTDNSFAVAQGLAAKDARVRASQLHQNCGASVARNTAIDLSMGVWIAVLDADDWYEPNRLEIMLQAARAAKADLICDNLKLYDHAKQKVVEETHYGFYKTIQPLTPEWLFRGDNPLVRHAIGYVKPMVRKEFLRNHNISYDPIHRAGQDYVFLAEIVLNNARGFVIPEALYIYVHRISPTTRKISPHSHASPRFKLIVQGCDELLQKYGSSMRPSARRALQQRRWIFQNRVRCDEMLAAMRLNRKTEAVMILAKNPFILVLMSATLAKLIYANLRMITKS